MLLEQSHHTSSTRGRQNRGPFSVERGETTSRVRIQILTICSNREILDCGQPDLSIQKEASGHHNLEIMHEDHLDRKTFCGASIRSDHYSGEPCRASSSAARY